MVEKNPAIILTLKNLISFTEIECRKKFFFKKRIALILFHIQDILFYFPLCLIYTQAKACHILKTHFSFLDSIALSK